MPAPSPSVPPDPEAGRPRGLPPLDVPQREELLSIQELLSDLSDEAREMLADRPAWPDRPDRPDRALASLVGGLAEARARLDVLLAARARALAGADMAHVAAALNRLSALLAPAATAEPERHS